MFNCFFFFCGVEIPENKWLFCLCHFSRAVRKYAVVETVILSLTGTTMNMQFCRKHTYLQMVIFSLLLEALKTTLCNLLHTVCDDSGFIDFKHIPGICSFYYFNSTRKDVAESAHTEVSTSILVRTPNHNVKDYK